MARLRFHRCPGLSVLLFSSQLHETKAAEIALEANEVDMTIMSAYLMIPAEFIDARILSEIDKSGYIDKLYASQSKCRLADKCGRDLLSWRGELASLIP